MTKTVPYFDIFLSSPGDVPLERNDAEAAINEINDTGEFSNHFVLRLYRWDDKRVVIPMPVEKIPQKSVDIYLTRPSECDLVVVIFWARMGSPMVMDGSEYLSGTHYEYSEALQGYEQQGSPTVWLYRCAEEPSLKLTDKDFDKKVQQFRRVEQFFKQFQDSEGRYTGGVNSYPTHADFKTLFKGQLLTYLRHLRDKPPAPPPPPPTKVTFTGVPYRGLNALTEDDAPIFFGRDVETLEVLSRVDNKRLVFVLGASGSGKSSLVAAGVLPKLRDRGWRVVRCVPGNDPFYNLALAAVSQVPEFGVAPTDYLTKARQLADVWRQDPANLTQQLTVTLPKARVLLFIDQFEEVFTLAMHNAQIHNDDRDDVGMFMQALRHPAADITTLVTMRADFYGSALPHFEALKQETYGLTQPSVFALYDLITRPAELAGLELDAGLAQDIVEAVGNESGALALVAYLMEALYLRAAERGDKQLRRTDYEALGGVQGAINKLAEQAYATLPFEADERKAVMRRVFRELVALTEEDGQLVPTRRRAANTLFADGSPEATFVRTFVDARLLVQSSDTVEVAHEAILKHWDQLRDWIGLVKSDLALFRQYERDAKTWQQRAQDSPQPTHEALVYFYRALKSLGLEWETLPEPLKAYTEPEQKRLLVELDGLPPTPEQEGRRRDIGDRLAVIGDTRLGVGVKDGLPEIVWLPVSGSGGQVTLKTDDNEIGPVTIPDFYIAKFQVTYAQYQAFVEAADGYYAEDMPWWDGMPERYQRQTLSNQRTKAANNPRDSISWYQAVAFARWLDAQYRESGKLGAFVADLPVALREKGLGDEGQWQLRLPTEWEWQWAAQAGQEAHNYPWGERKAGHANTTESGLGRAIAVGMYPHGAATCGALDLSGNLREWCQNEHKEWHVVDGFGTGNSKVLRGGSFANHLDLAAASSRNFNFPFVVYYNYGLRLVLSRPIY